MRTMRRVVMVVLSALAMLGLLFAAASLSLGRPDGALFYLAVIAVAVALVTRLWRTERRLRRADEALLPPELRPVRRVPRRPISFPIVESVVTFLVWYALAVAVERVVSGTISSFTLVAIAPFAAFMLTMLTVAGRHMAFRITAEESDGERGGPRRS